jgi:2-methylisocitrate lyase-like PEP mutase family enzyme
MPSRPADAERFHALHAGPDVLILANGWDALSARLVENAGAKAVATSSAAVAWAHGYADGHHLPVERLVVTVEEIARVVSLPITVDIEGGYTDDPVEVGKNVAAVIKAGGVGINIEDGVLLPDLLCEKIAAARETALRLGVNLFINARTDVYLHRLAKGDAAREETIARGRRYKAAGASGLFVPGPTDPALFEAIAKAVDLPLNVMARQGVPPPAELKKRGVRRLSAATWLSLSAYHHMQDLARAFLTAGDCDALAAAGVPGSYDKLFAPKS